MASCISMVTKKELLDAAEKGKLAVGTRSVMRELKRGKITAVLHAENCPAEPLTNIKQMATISNAKVEGFKGNSRALGEALGKPFNIVLVGIRK